MDNYFDSLKRAKRNIHIADHMLTQTYPLVKDPKLLIAVMDNIFLSMSNAMDSLVFYEREMKTIPPFHNSYESKFDILKLKLAGKHSIDKEQLMMMQDIKNMIVQHKKAPVEFARKDKFVICSEEYNLTSVSLQQMKNFINHARKFLDKVNKIIGEEDG
ncbi:hypothetical protein ACFL96_09000 [Thermoproteota archaeon]